MPYHIEKTGSIFDSEKLMYYKGDQSWTDERKNRKVYRYKKDAVSDVPQGANVISE